MNTNGQITGESDAFVNSIIGEGTTLHGDFDINGLLRIDGVFFGRVKTSGKVLIGKNGSAECEIIAGTVVIGGKVRGEIIALEKIILLSTGELIGNIKTPRLTIEEGVIFNGKCEIIEDTDKLEKIKKEYFEQERSRPVNRFTPKENIGSRNRFANTPVGDTSKQYIKTGVSDKEAQKVT
jgi:cytoskeletal protein CcmA (bactofilin family)